METQTNLKNGSDAKQNNMKGTFKEYVVPIYGPNFYFFMSTLHKSHHQVEDRGQEGVEGWSKCFTP